MLEALIAFSKTWKGICTSIGIVLVLLFVFFYQINSCIGESENELIDIEESNVPLPSDFDALCAMSNEGKPCPKLSKPKMRCTRNPFGSDCERE
jgi:hypothetical protein